MDKEKQNTVLFGLIRIGDYTAVVQDALDHDPEADNYCREIWDACESLKAIVDKLSTCG